MLKSEKKPIWQWLGRNILVGLLRKQFQAIHLRLPSELYELHQQSILLCANHSCRWDGLVMMYLTESCLGLDGYLMMASTVMQQYPVLSKFGCFEVDIANPFRVNASINYAAQLINGQMGRGLIIFPQGEYARSLRRPLGFHPGAAQIARKARESIILPVSLYYDYFITQLPEVFISVGQPIRVCKADHTTQELTQTIEQAVTWELDNLQTAVSENQVCLFQTVLRGQDSLQFWLLKKFDPQWERRAMPIHNP